MPQELFRIIEEYANAECTADELREWLATNVQAVLDSGDARAVSIVNHLEADFARLSEGLIPEEDIFDLANALTLIARTDRRELRERKTVVSSSSSPVYRGNPNRADRVVRVA